MRINCDDCQMQGTSHCDDCLVTALLHPPEGAVEIPDELGSSLGALSGEGLVPVLRFRPRTEPEDEMVSDTDAAKDAEAG
jgi:hypothetical protein